MEENELVQPEQEELAADAATEPEETVEDAELSETAEVDGEPDPEQAAAEEEAEETPEKETKPDQVDETPEVDPDTPLGKALTELEKLNRRLGYEQRQRERIEKQLRQTQQPRKLDANAPKQDDFESDEEYLEARTIYEIQKGIHEYQQQQAQLSQQSSIESFIEETTTAGREMFEDFDSVALAETVPITQPMLQIMQDCERPEAVAYYLGKNVKDATAISRMSPIQQARAIAQVEMKVNQELASNPTGKAGVANTPAKKPVSNAPPPVKPTGSANVVDKSPDKMTQAEYEAWRAKQRGR